MKVNTLKQISNLVLILGIIFAGFLLIYFGDIVGFVITIISSGITSGYFFAQYKKHKRIEDNMNGEIST
jgi:hypothetical protein